MDTSLMTTAAPLRKSRPAVAWRTVTAVAIGCLAGGAVGAAGGRPAAAPKLIGNPAAGKSLFVTRCGVCHVMKAAGTAGTIGGNLDKVKLTEAQIIKAITLGGASVMSKAALAKFPTQMTGFRGTLTVTQIDDIAAFEYTASAQTSAAKK